MLELCCPFGWSGSPGFYDLFARAIKHVQAKTVDPDDADGSIGPYFAYYWVDDHIPVEPDIRNRCKTAEFALKGAIVTVLGPYAINYGKVTKISEEECVLGVDLDTAGLVVRMPHEKVSKALTVIDTCLAKTMLSRKDLQAVEGSLRFVALCFRPGLAFIQNIQAQMLLTNKGKRRLAKGTMLDLEFWKMIITSDLLSTGIQMDSYCDESIPQVGCV